jgi:hypothetical protein
MIDFHVYEARKVPSVGGGGKETQQIGSPSTGTDAGHARVGGEAAKHPKRWHAIGKLEATQRTAQLLAKRGVIEIWPETNQYRLKVVK